MSSVRIVTKKLSDGACPEDQALWAVLTGRVEGVGDMVAKERFCPNCGDSMGVLDYIERFDTCGKPECEAEGRLEMQAEREDLHRELDERLGY